VTPAPPPDPALSLAQRPGRTGKARRPKLQDYLSVPAAARCVRGAKVRVRTRTGRRREISLVSVAANGRTVRLGPARLSTRVTVKLTRRHTPVSVTLRLDDGRRTTKSYTFTRCG
jgi:hypothetical protein